MRRDSRWSSRTRARSIAWVWLVAFLAPGWVTPGSAVAQVDGRNPVPSDTVPADTALVPIPPDQVAGDTIPTALEEAAQADSTVLEITDFPTLFRESWAAGRWELTRDEIAHLPGMTLLEMIELLPGMTRFRAGGFGRPEGITALGAGGARVRVFLDGFELDPLGTGSFQLETIPIQDVDRVTVERTIAGIRVDVRSYRLDQPEPASVIQLGTGVFNTRELRAHFSRELGSRSIATGAFDLATTGGIGIDEKYTHTNATARWSYAATDHSALELEWRRTAIDRDGTLFPQGTSRHDLILRGQSQLSDRFTVGAILGRSDTEEDLDEEVPDELGTLQAAVRAAYDGEILGAEASARVRRRGDPAVPLPGFETQFRGRFDPTSWVSVEAEAALAGGDDLTASMAEATATISPFPALSLFGSIDLGSRFLPYPGVEAPPPEPSEDPDAPPQQEEGLPARLVRVDVDGVRAGIQFAGDYGAAGVAGFRSSSTPIAPFGLAFDRGSPLTDTAPVTGAEAFIAASIPGTGGALNLDGWVTWFQSVEGRPYTPERIGRLALVFSDQYYEGELEPTFRFEGIYRGRAIVPGTPGGPFDFVTEPYWAANFSFKLRILDVTAFLLWENLLATEQAVDLPSAPEVAPRLVYGASWRFSN